MYCIYRWSIRNSAIQTIAGATGILGADTQHQNMSVGVGLDSRGNLYVVEQHTHCVQKLDFVSGHPWYRVFCKLHKKYMIK
jgi:hypothetical protein